jgi:hypothetical protein
VEQESGPPSTEGTRDETRPPGRFTRDPGASRPEVDLEQVGPAAPPDDEPAQPLADATATESQKEEGAPIMSSLPHSRPQQRSEKRAAPKRSASRQTAASKSGRKQASGRSRASAGTASRARSKAAASKQRSRAATPPSPKRDEGLPARAIDTGIQIATAPLKLTAAVTRRTANIIGRRLGL